MAWRPLCLSPSTSSLLPPLLLSFAFHPDSSYTIHLTDLTYIWSESLSRRDILRRSREEGTSIDPNNDASQFRIFLEKIKLGLEGGQGTTSALTINADEDRFPITLNLSVKLPGGLAPLEWPVRFSAGPQAQLTSQLIVPLMAAQQIRIQEVTSLAEALRDKDHVIQKLLDKLESQGTELGEMFPQMAGKAGRKVNRKKAEERVRGLGQFNMNSWRQELKKDVSHDAASLIREVFQGDVGDGDAVAVNGTENEDQDEISDLWWENIKGITVNLNTGKISTNLGKSRSQKSKSPMKQDLPKPIRKPSPTKDDSSDDNGDFQVQSSPPRLTSRSHRIASAEATKISSDEDDDLDAPSQVSKITDSYPVSQPLPSPLPASPKKSKGIDKVGRNKAAKVTSIETNKTTDDDVSSPPKILGIRGKKASPKRTSAVELDGKSTEGLLQLQYKKSQALSETETESPSPSPKAIPAQEKSPAHKSKGKLGAIGITKRATAKEISSDSESENNAETKFTKKKSKLGAIGSKKKPTANESSTDTESNEGPEMVSPKKKGKLGTIRGKKKAVAKDSSTDSGSEDATDNNLAKKKGKLGTIGRKGRAAVKNSSSDTESEAAQKESPTRKRKLGAIGQIENSPSPTPSDDDGKKPRGRTAVKIEKEKTPEVKETSQERADKKRLQLKKELDAKAKAPPPKKKRKF